MRACPICGRDNPDDANFCAGCATSLHDQGRQERKVVTVVFCDLVGFTGRAEAMDPEDVGALLGPYHARLRTELERFGGTVEKFIGDAVVAVFGAPIAHEDDPERALRAALAIRDWARETGELELRTAVNTGEALVSVGSGIARGEGMVAGDVINTASRLQSAAPVNGILVGEHTYRATRDQIGYASHEPIRAKGKSEPIVVWEAVAARSRLGGGVEMHTRTEFVGRARELRLLREAFDRSRDEQLVQLVTLVAGPGAGKSRLVRELARIVDADSQLVSWRQGRCLPYGDGISFWALAEIVKAETGILESDAPDIAHAKLVDSVAALLPPEEADWVERRLRPLVGLGEEARTHGAIEEAVPAWRRYLEALGERGPCVLVVEDLHWADDGLLDFLDELADWASSLPLLLVCTARPELLTRRPSWGGGRTNAVALSLPPLSDEDTAALVKNVLHGAALDAALLPSLLERAGGNPLYAEEFARMLTEHRGGELAVPDSVQGIIAARLDSLTEIERRVIRSASVIGAVFWVGTIAAVGDLDAGETEDALRQLERREFVRRERRSSVERETEYAFRHVLVRDVSYAQIPRAERSDRHRRAAHWIASLGRPDDYAEVLAHHYVEAITYAAAAGADVGELADPARTALRDAGDRAMRLAAYRQARRFFEGALELTPREHPDHADLLFRLGSAQFRWDSSGEDVLAAALDALRLTGQYETAARCAVQAARSAWSRGDRAAVDEWMATADALLVESPDSVVRVEALVVRSAFFMLAGEDTRAILVATEALGRLDALDRPDLHARALDVLGASRCNLGDEGGLEDARRAIEIAREGRALWELHHATNNLISDEGRFGRIHEMIRLVDEWEELLDEYGGTNYSRVWFQLARAEADYAAGRWDRAIDALDRYTELIPKGRSHYLEPEAFGLRALIAFARGDDDVPRHYIEHGLDVADRAGDAQMIAPSLCWRARFNLELGARAAARADLDRVLAIRETLTSSLGNAISDCAWLAVDLDRRAEAAALEPTAFPRWAAVARSILAGDAVGAADALAEMGDRQAEAYARLRAGGDHAQVALAFYRSVGADRYIARAEQALHRGATRPSA